MASWTHEAVYEEAERRAATALVNLVADPSPPARAELERQLDNLRAAGLAISRTGTARRRPKDDGGHERSLQADRGSSPPHAWGSRERAGQLLWLLSVLGLVALAWLPLVALVLVTV